MGRPYATEIEQLPDTFAWATNVDIKMLQDAVRIAGSFPLRAIGSGGSLSAAHALAAFHQQYAGKLATIATPLEVVNEPLESGISNWLLSAGGGNVDILAAARTLIRREPRQLAILCGRENSPLVELGRAHPFTDLLIFPPPSGKDGFLATNSLLSFIALLARAYAVEFGAGDQWRTAANIVEDALNGRSDLIANWDTEIEPLWSRPTTIILHGPSTRVGAVDLESKFTEAAVGSVQLADYRNFAHGRHYWLAKHGETSAVLALITETDRALAERTLDIIPADIPQGRLSIPGEAMTTELLALVASLRICGSAAAARGIDPGRPKVPDFGRRLYNLPLPRPHVVPSLKISPRDAAAIVRKSGVSIEHLSDAGELNYWQVALDAFRNRLNATKFGGIIFDYDGTLVDTRERFRPPPQPICVELIRILDSGAWIAVATGRGASVRKDLQSSLPPSLWSRVLLGYYNGAELATLQSDEVPDGRNETCDELIPLAAALRAQPELAQSARQTDRPYQITLEPTRVLPNSRLWELAHQVIGTAQVPDVCVTRSSHSIDIVGKGVSKLNVVSFLQTKVGDVPLLTIGDCGRWPGNDYQLLHTMYSLGVDEISVDFETCWNLATPGQRGPFATLDYLRALDHLDGQVRFRAGSLK